MKRRSNAGDYPYRKKVNATGVRRHNSDVGENTDVARAISKFQLNISEPILDPTTTRTYGLQLDDSKLSGAVDVAQWSGIARQRDLWTQELRASGVVSPDYIPVVDAGMNAVIWELLNLMPISNVVGYAINVYTQDPSQVDEVPPYGVNYTVAEYKALNANDSGLYPTPFHHVVDGFPPNQPGFVDSWNDNDNIGYFSIAVPVQGGGTPSTQPSPQQLIDVAIDFAEIAGLAALPELIAPEIVAGELVGTEAPFIFGPLTAHPTELPLIGAPRVALPPALLQIVDGTGTELTKSVYRVFNNDSTVLYDGGANPTGKRFLGYLTKYTLPDATSTPGIIDQPPITPDVPNCCGGITIPILTGGEIITNPGGYTPLPPIPAPAPATPNPTQPPTNPNPTTPIDTLFTCQEVYHNPGNTIAPNLIQVVENEVNVGGGINNALDNIGGSLTPPLNKTCDIPIAIIVAFKSERLTYAGGWPNLNDTVFSRPLKMLEDLGQGLTYLFEPVPSSTNSYANIPTIGFTSVDAVYQQSDKYLIPIKQWGDVYGMIIDGSFVQVDNSNNPGLYFYLCGIRRVPSDVGLPVQTYFESLAVGENSNSQRGARPGFGSFYHLMQATGKVTCPDYQSGTGTHQVICSRNERTSVIVNTGRGFENIPGTHTFTGTYDVSVTLKDRFNGTLGTGYSQSVTHSNAASMTTSDTFDFSGVDWSQVSYVDVGIGACDEGQNAGVVTHYYYNASWQ